MRISQLKIYLSALLLLCALSLRAEGYWKTMFAYNNVVQIAMTPDKVFAVSDGALFSVDKQTEGIETYNSASGLNGSKIVCIY